MFHESGSRDALEFLSFNFFFVYVYLQTVTIYQFQIVIVCIFHYWKNVDFKNDSKKIISTQVIV